jgi:type I restriction enzyme R subunit
VKLAATPERFDIRNLQKAHELHYRKALVDIISMIKHAARDGEPLLTAEERVERAFAKVVAGKTFTADQDQWLGLIKAHLAQTLTIDREDFENIPLFFRRGGLSQATRVFAEQLDNLFAQLNEAVAQ